jgi:ribonuclease D
MQIITDTNTLQSFCKRLAEHEFITVDTEFMRERTYWSQLCLIQAASPVEEAIIDPLADGLDLAPFLELLQDRNVTKVFHAARQDIEIFYQLIGDVPRPLFDTQVAAMACGHGDQIGYEPLVRALTGQGLDKGSRFTDWSRRPLSERQLTYALGDVTHLRDVYVKLVEQLKQSNRFHWVQEEMEALLNPQLYFVEPKEAWKRLKLRNPKKREIGPTMKIAEWREAEAQRKDVPRNRILKDDVIIELARQAPTSPKALAGCRGIPNGFERTNTAKGLIAAIKEGKEMPDEALPDLERKRDMTPIPADVLDMLRVLLKRQCEHYDVAPKLIASAADLEKIARHEEPDIPAMNGWRREVFGEAALKMKRGELAMKLEGSTVVLVESA